MPDQENVWSVKALTNYLRRRLEEDQYLQSIHVEGEVSNFYLAQSGNIFFDLKEDKTVLHCMMFSYYVANMSYLPEDGDQVIVRGSVSIYESQGRYQLVCTNIVSNGLGDLSIQFERLKKKLNEEGYFSEDHKIDIPTYPSSIGVITGKDSDAYNDVVRTVARRWPIATIVPYFTLVQGAQAKDMLIPTIKKADQGNHDVLLLVRGGGSLEDLWTFNEEEVVHAVYDCETPIICGVGHEMDVTLVDYTCDLRASTPTAAAELCTPNWKDEVARLDGLEYALNQSMQYRMNQEMNQFQQLKKAFRQELQLHQQNENNRIERLKKDLLMKKNERFQQENHQLTHYENMLLLKMKGMKQNYHQHFQQVIQLFDAYSPLKNLQRGFSIAYDEKKNMIRSVEDIDQGDKITIEVIDGTIKAEVKEKTYGSKKTG